MFIRAAFRIIAFFALTWIYLAGAGGPPFDGVWKREWSNTTPQGVHQVGSRTIMIRTTGVSSELSRSD